MRLLTAHPITRLECKSRNEEDKKTVKDRFPDECQIKPPLTGPDVRDIVRFTPLEPMARRAHPISGSGHLPRNLGPAGWGLC